MIFAWVERLFKPAGMQNSPATRNLRLNEQIHPQEAPDPIRQSDFVNQGRIYGYPAAQQVYTAIQPALFPATWEEDRFGGAGRTGRFFTPNIGAWDIGGHQSEFGIRPNIERPPAMAYGSLFTLPGSGN